MKTATRLLLPKVLGRNSKYSFVNAEAAAVVARFSTQPTKSRKALIDNFVGSIKASGAWERLDALYLLAAADAQAAQRNLIGDVYNLTPNNAPVFTADRGYTPNGTTSYLDLGVNANALAKYQQDDASLALWSRTNLPNGGASSSDVGHPTGYIGRNSANSSAVLRINTSAGVATPSGMAFPGFVAWSRTAPTAWAGYSGNTKRGTGVDASAALGAVPVSILRRDVALPGANQIAAMFIGQSLSDAQMLSTYNALNTYLTAVGAA